MGNQELLRLQKFATIDTDYIITAPDVSTVSIDAFMPILVCIEAYLCTPSLKMELSTWPHITSVAIQSPKDVLKIIAQSFPARMNY